VDRLPISSAFALGFRALVREAWLAAVGFLVALARRSLDLAATAVVLVLLARGAIAGLRAAPFDARAPLEGMLFVASQPRFLLVVLGVWAAGRLLGVALRLAWLAGALPTLAAALQPVPDGAPRFATGVAYGLPRLVPVAFLGFLMEVGGGGFALALLLGALRISGAAALEGNAWLAAPVALALTLAVAVPLSLSLLSDLALVRAGTRGEGPLEALASATRRLVGRPSAYLAAALLFGAFGLVGVAALQGLGSAATGFVPAAPGLQLGPQLMLAALAAAAGAAAELWWLASLAALATHEG
jgi:hypothetical protein